MNKALVSCFLIVVSLVFISCGKPTISAIGATNPSDIVATLNGTNILASELEEVAKGRLQRIDQEIYNIKKDALEDLIETKLIEQAAAKASKSADDYLKENVDDKATQPTEDEIKSFYEARKDQLGKKTLKEVQNDIKSYLFQGRQQSARQQLIGGLRASADVKINLEPPRMKVDAGDNPSIGPKSAPVTIVEFTDYQCPFCSRVRGTINQVLDEYKDKVRYVLRDFPLSFHQYAKKTHEAAHCAGDQDKYWEYNKLIWANQTALQVDKLKEYAKQSKLNTKKFDECLDKGKFAKKVEENVDYGASVGASGTPSFFINGIAFSGARPFSDFKSIIDEELKRK